jgi:hypothetical protein
MHTTLLESQPIGSSISPVPEITSSMSEASVGTSSGESAVLFLRLVYEICVRNLIARL